MPLPVWGGGFAGVQHAAAYLCQTFLRLLGFRPRRHLFLNQDPPRRTHDLDANARSGGGLGVTQTLSLSLSPLCCNFGGDPFLEDRNLVIFFYLSEAPLPDPTPTPPNTPKRTRNGPETDPKRSQTDPKRTETELKWTVY